MQKLSHRIVALALTTVLLGGCSTEILHRAGSGGTILRPAGSSGTIVVAVTRLTMTSQPGQQEPSTIVRTIIETSAAGNPERSLLSTSDMPSGYESGTAGNSIEFYDPTENTIYVTTLPAWVRANQASILRQTKQQSSPGNVESSSVGVSASPGPTFSPGRESLYEQELHQHLYKLAGRTTIDGHAALKLVPTHDSSPGAQRSTGPGSYQSDLQLGTVYVEPGTYYPIRQVIRIPGATGLVTDWLLYKVLPATKLNQRLASLIASHPHARVVHSATAYLRAEGRMADH